MSSETKRTRRWGWRTAVVAAALVLVFSAWCLRGAALRRLAEMLVVDQNPGRFNVLWIMDEEVDRRFDLAAELYRTCGCRIAIAKPVSTRVARMGIEPDGESLARRELGKRGVPVDALLVVDGPPGPEWTEGRILADWLRQRPEYQVLVVCRRFRSAAYRRELDRLLGPEQRGRVAVRGIRNRRYDETNWWQSRLGAKEFFVSWVSPGRTRMSSQADADRYEQGLLRQWRGTP